MLRDALARADRLAPDHPTRLYVLRSLSELLRTRGAVAEAARVGRGAAEGAARAWPPDYPFQWSFLTTWGRALALTESKNPAILDTLAAACAETGDFTRAAAVAKSGIDLALALGDRALADTLNERLQRYRAQQPMRDDFGG